MNRAKTKGWLPIIYISLSVGGSQVINSKFLVYFNSQIFWGSLLDKIQNKNVIGDLEFSKKEDLKQTASFYFKDHSFLPTKQQFMSAYGTRNWFTHDGELCLCFCLYPSDALSRHLVLDTSLMLLNLAWVPHHVLHTAGHHQPE